MHNSVNVHKCSNVVTEFGTEFHAPLLPSMAHKLLFILSCIAFTFLIIVSGWIHHFILVLIILMVLDCLHIFVIFFDIQLLLDKKIFRSKAVTWWNSLPS